MKEKIVKIIETVGRLDRAKLCWYAGLAVLLTALGAASYGWRNRASVRYERPSAEDAPLAAMADAAPSAQDFLTALPTPAPTPEPLTFQWPVEGEILRGYAPESLVWSETLEQWENHPGVDIAAAAGEAVYACADGVVSDAFEDALWGKVIQIAHAEGYVSTCANLSTLALVKAGDAVQAGQAISAVGQSASCESEMPWHVHFALEKDGKTVDFEKIVRQSES